MTKLAIFYLFVGLSGVGVFSHLTTSGWARSKQITRFVPQSVRNSPNGYRSFHYWHVGYGGYRGGK